MSVTDPMYILRLSSLQIESLLLPIWAPKSQIWEGKLRKQIQKIAHIPIFSSDPHKVCGIYANSFSPYADMGVEWILVVFEEACIDFSIKLQHRTHYWTTQVDYRNPQVLSPSLFCLWPNIRGGPITCSFFPRSIESDLLCAHVVVDFN